MDWLHQLGAELAAHDVDKTPLDRLRSQAQVRTFPSLEALWEWQPRRVLIATPPNTHSELAIAALRAGADVLVEKPIAATLDQARAILHTAEAQGRQAWVVCNKRFHCGPATVKVHLHRIGEPLFARAHFGHRLAQMRPVGAKVFAASKAQGGGVVLDCIHEIDYLQWYFGEVRYTRSWIGQIGPERIDAEDFAEIWLTFHSGVRAAVHLDFLRRHKRRGVEVVGTDGSLLWASEGKAPEGCTVSFRQQDSIETLLCIDSVDPSTEYREMLQIFLGDGVALASASDGVRALAVALQARSQSC